MAKLKYDRPINFYLNEGQTTTIPADEVWKLSLGFGTNPGMQTLVCGGGFKLRKSLSSLYTGIAFKHIDE